MVNKLLFLACVLLLLFINTAQVDAQSNAVLYPRLTINVNDIPLRDFLAQIEQQTSYKFAYNTELILNQKNITLHVYNKPLDELVQMALKGSNIDYTIIDNQIVLNEILPSASITLSGYIRDSNTGESLPGAIIYLPNLKAGTYTNDYGFYSITQNRTDSLELLISYLGFNRVYRKVNARHNVSQDFYLTENKIPLDTILVSATGPDDNVKKQPLGKTVIPNEMIKTPPSISGNGDIVNTIQMMPGVMAGLDGRPGYFIRGGNTDQNLVQLDEATLYNPNHLLGLVGIFNSSAIKSAYLMKAGFPASFGDHLSSILDVTMKDGNDQQFGGDVQAGTVTGGATIYGPLIKNNASFFVSARRSTIDLLLKPMDFSNYYSNYYFYDINAKVNFKITPNDRIYLSFYQGRDNSSYSNGSTNAIDYRVNYGNQATTLRWNHLFSQKMFLNTSLIYNNYHHQVNARQDNFYAELYSGIGDMEMKTDVNYYPNVNHKISVGVDYNYQTLLPATVSNKSVSPETDVTINPSDVKRKYCSRLAAYFSDEVRLSDKLSAYIGGRVPFFYKNDVQYLQFEPRVSLLRMLNSTTSIKLSYTQMHQYLHMVQSYNSSFPAEVWIGSSKTVKPENSQEASIGLFKNYNENMFHTSFEVYYKQMGNQLLFKGTSTPAINSNLETSLIFGKGQSYGAEFFIEKTKGKLTGWVAYSLSYAYQQFDKLNNGHQFPFANDRRHSVYLSMSYEVGKHWRMSSNFVFTSGRAFTVFPDSVKSSSNSNPLYYYSNNNNNNKSGTASSSSSGLGKSPDGYSGTGFEKSSGESGNDNPGGGHVTNQGQDASSYTIAQNNFRLAPYHRLDISISYHKTRNLRKHVLESELVFSVYNVYARHNTFFAYCSIDPHTSKPIAVQVSFVPVIPSLSYNLKF